MRRAPDHRRISRRRAAPWRGACLLACVLLAGGCSVETRHEVLTFFFDGVPPLGGFEAEAVPGPLDPDAAVDGPAARPLGSRHAPVFQRQCGECHDLRRGFELHDQGIGLCDRCHGERRIAEGWDHGPINLGSCLPCHRAHQSPHPSLLDKPLPELCRHCHVDDGQPNDTYHNLPRDRFENCTLCHSPHRIQPATPPPPARQTDEVE